MAKLNTGATYRVALDTEHTFVYIDASDKKDLIKFLFDTYVGDHSICGVKRLGKDGMLYPEAIITDPLFKELAFQKQLSISARETPKKIYLLCQEYEDKDAIREFSVLAVSEDYSALKNLMQAKIKQDEYGFVQNKGILQNTENSFCTNFSSGFLEYYILSQDLLSRNKIQKRVEAIQNSTSSPKREEELPSLDQQVKEAASSIQTKTTHLTSSTLER